MKGLGGKVFLWIFLHIATLVASQILQFFPKLSSYYYSTLKIKIDESISIKLCSEANSFAKINIEVIPPPDMIINEWNTMKSIKLSHGVSSNLCQSPYFKSYLNEFHACHSSSLNHKHGIRSVSHFHSDHPRCHRSEISNLCSPNGKVFTLMPISIAFQHFPFLINTTFPIIISRSGMLLTKCGILGLYNSCKSHSSSLYASFLDGPSSKYSGRNASLCYTSVPTRCPYPTIEILFIASQYDDTQIGQFFLESLPRIVYHLDFLLSNPHIQIHYGFNKKSITNTFLSNSLLSYQYFDFVGIDSHRLVNGPIRVTKYALLPREGGCQDAAYTSWELHFMRNKLLQLANTKQSSDIWLSSSLPGRPFTFPSSESCNVLILYRTLRFSKDILDNIVSILEKDHQAHQPICSHRNSTTMDIRIFSDNDEILMKCIPCQIKLFSQANLVIGVHGAGLMNTIFLPTNSVVIEIVPQNGMDSRHIPVNGIFPRLSAVFGLHHFLYLDNLTSPQFPHQLVENIRNFLKSIQ